MIGRLEDKIEKRDRETAILQFYINVSKIGLFSVFLLLWDARGSNNTSIKNNNVQLTSIGFPGLPCN